MSKIRIFVEEVILNQSKQFLKTELKIIGNNFDYLTKVMRLKINDLFFVFNGLDGEFEAKIINIEKKFLQASIIKKTSNLTATSKITIAFALIKNVRIDFIASKATELGVAKFQPLTTERTIVNKINYDRFKANVKEACEQCGRNDFPQISSLKTLEKFLQENSLNKIYILCDESGNAQKSSFVLSEIAKNLQKNNSTQETEFIIIVGPEGGFTEKEFNKIYQLGNSYNISMGPRILRSDTAIISAITLVQEFLGDFNLKPNFIY